VLVATGLLVLAWIAVLGILVRVYGPVRVAGQIARHALAPGVRSLTQSDAAKLAMPRAVVRRHRWGTRT
jgi:hypothetical protein